MKKLITLTAGLLVASSAFASVQTTYNETSIFTQSYETKAEAYDAGFDVTDSLSAMTETQLRSELPSFADNSIRNIEIDGAEVKIEEFAAARGDVQYRAVVDVNYHFDAKERN